MNITYWITLSQGIACAVLLITATVLWCGEWPKVNDEQHHTNYLLRMMAIGNLVAALSFVPYLTFDSLGEPVDAVWHYLADTFCVIVMAFLAMEAIILRQKHLSWFHWTSLVVLPSLVTILIALIGLPQTTVLENK